MMGWRDQRLLARVRRVGRSCGFHRPMWLRRVHQRRKKAQVRDVINKVLGRPA